MIKNKQAMDYTSDPKDFNVGNVLNSFNPAARFKLFEGKYYVPNSFKLSSDPGINATAYQASLIGGTALLVSFLGRGMFNKTVTEEVKGDRLKRLDSTLSASNPKFDPEPIKGKPSVQDFERDPDFNRQVHSLRKEMGPQLVKDAGGWFDEMSGETAKMAVPLAALYLGTVGGYTLADNLYNANYKKQLKGDIDKSQKLLDAINYQRLLEARKSPADLKQEMADKLAKKQMQEMPAPAPITAPAPELAKTAGDKDGQSWLGAGGSVLGMLMLSTALTSAVVSKRYFDSQDPDRAAQSATKAALTEMAKQEQGDLPAEIQPLDTDLVNTLNAHLKNIKRMPENPIRPTESVPIDMQEAAFKL